MKKNGDNDNDTRIGTVAALFLFLTCLGHPRRNILRAL